MKYKEGPWEIGIDELGEQLPGFVPINACGHGSLALVVWVMEDDKRTPECEANAHLIAAAPDLFEALEELCKGFDSVSYTAWTPSMHKAVGALAKARGESVDK
jgi:hypothetical protein